MAVSAFDAVWNWSESADCPVQFWRDEDGDWRVTVETRDGKIWRRATGTVPEATIRVRDDDGKLRAETEAESIERIRLHMKRIVRQAYEARVPKPVYSRAA
jgi:hypothetical protein